MQAATYLYRRNDGLTTGEFIQGQTLDAKINEGPLWLEDAIRIASEVATALEAANTKDIVQRDKTGTWSNPEVVRDLYQFGGDILSNTPATDLFAIFGFLRQWAVFRSDDAAFLYAEVIDVQNNETWLFSVSAADGTARMVLSLPLSSHVSSNARLKDSTLYYAFKETDGDIWLIDLVERWILDRGMPPRVFTHSLS